MHYSSIALFNGVGNYVTSRTYVATTWQPMINGLATSVQFSFVAYYAPQQAIITDLSHRLQPRVRHRKLKQSDAESMSQLYRLFTTSHLTRYHD